MNDVSILTDNGVDLDSALELLGDLEFYDETLESFLTENETRIPNIEKYKKELNMEDNSKLVLGTSAVFVGIVIVILSGAIETFLRFIIGILLL